jgi:hypothetical protein
MVDVVEPGEGIEAGYAALIAGAVALSVNILVFNRVVGSLPLDGSGAITFADLLPQIQAAFDLAPVGLIILVAGMILVVDSGRRPRVELLD